MKGTGAKRNVCPGSCVSTGAKFPVAPVESAPMKQATDKTVRNVRRILGRGDNAPLPPEANKILKI